MNDLCLQTLPVSLVGFLIRFTARSRQRRQLPSTTRQPRYLIQAAPFL